MDLAVKNRSKKEVVLNRREIKKIAETVLKYKNKNPKDDWEISCVFVTKDEIREINKEYRNIDKATDVISFAFQEGGGAELNPFVLGDLIISPEIVSNHAKKYGVSERKELTFVLVHGLLHLLGDDHIDKEDREIMRKNEADIMEKLSFIFDDNIKDSQN